MVCNRCNRSRCFRVLYKVAVLKNFTEKSWNFSFLVKLLFGNVGKNDLLHSFFSFELWEIFQNSHLPEDLPTTEAGFKSVFSNCPEMPFWSVLSLNCYPLLKIYTSHAKTKFRSVRMINFLWFLVPQF